VKYAARIIRKVPESILKTALTGKKLGSKAYTKMWVLFKETKFSIPSVTVILSKIKDAKHIDSAIDITKKLKKGGTLFISKAGERGLQTYEYFKKWFSGTRSDCCNFSCGGNGVVSILDFMGNFCRFKKLYEPSNIFEE